MESMQSLITLLAHAERERDAALAELRRRQIDERNAQAQAEQLQTYRREYEQRWSGEFSRSGSSGIAIVQCYQGFVTRLGQAIDQQVRIAQAAAVRLAQAETIWRECELRVAAVGKLIGRRQAQVRAVDARREQKLLDEQASRIAWARRTDRLASA